MRQFTIYEEATGRILKVLTQEKAPVLTEGLMFIEGNYPDDQFDIVDGAPVKSPKETRRVPPPSEAEKREFLTPQGRVRAKRNALLAASDWTQIPDAPVDASAWATYRQLLRDLPTQQGFPDVIWPDPPENN